MTEREGADGLSAVQSRKSNTFVEPRSFVRIIIVKLLKVIPN